MLHLLRLTTEQPQLLLAHAEAYGDLMAQEVALASRVWRSRLLLGALTILLLCMSGILGGVALMLWASMPAAQIHSPWVLWLIAWVPMVAAVVCGVQLQRAMKCSVFFDLRTQMKEDLALLRKVNASP